jgi:predicted RNase H-like HicB family nuclease
MKIDLSEGLNLRVEGEIGKYNTLPVEYLVKLAQNLQQLLQNIAEYQLEVDGAIDLSNFKVELSGFRIGSAIPEFKFTPRIKTVTSGDVLQQRKFVNNKFENYLEVANVGDYGEIRSLVPQVAIRNIIVQDLYNFTTTFGNSPFSVVQLKKNKITPVYKIHKFKAEIRDKLLTTITQSEELKEEFDAVAKVKVIKRGGVIKRIPKEMFIGKHADTAYSTDIIVHNNRAYILASPLLCKLEKEDDYYVIESEMLGIVGTGLTIDDAEQNFSEEFHYVYLRYNQLPEKEMSERVKRIKSILNSMITKIEE